MNTNNSGYLLAALLRLEQARQPLTDRNTLPALLTVVAEEIRTACHLGYVAITLQADVFVPPFPVIVSVGRLLPNSGHELIQQPIRWGGTQVATLDMTPAPDPLHQGVLLLLLRAAGESIAEVRAAELLAQTLELETRRWLANEVHDTVKQVLPAIRLLAERAEEHVYDPADVIDLLRMIREAAQQGLEELSFLLGGLRDQCPDHDLQAAIERLLGYLARTSPHLQIQATIDLPSMSWEIAACVLGVVRNALMNVVQHAGAHHVQLRIGPQDGGLSITIGDDGIGCPPEVAVAAPGIGLESMMERVTQLGGRSTIASSSGGGMTLDVWLPQRYTEGAHG